MKEYTSHLWEVRTVEVSGSSQPQSWSSAGDLRGTTVVEGQMRTGQAGKFIHSHRGSDR